MRGSADNTRDMKQVALSDVRSIDGHDRHVMLQFFGLGKGYFQA